MKFEIITVGKKHDKNLVDYIHEFEKRIKSYFPLEWIYLKSEDDDNEKIQIKKESFKILEILEKSQASDFIILLYVTGEERNTIDITNFLAGKMNEGVSKIIFVIGGAFGVDETVTHKVDFIWSFSKLVFPHQLVRAIFIEQLYRCISILKNSKYHH